MQYSSIHLSNEETNLLALPAGTSYFLKDYLQDPSHASWPIPGVLLQNGVHKDGPSRETLPTAQIEPTRVEVLVHVHHGQDALIVQRLRKQSILYQENLLKPCRKFASSSLKYHLRESGILKTPSDLPSSREAL